MKTLKRLLLVVIASMVLPVQANQTVCGDKPISIAEMTWLSAGALAQTLRTIIETGYQCDVTMIPGDTVPTTSSLISKGRPDIVPELWPNSVQPQLEKILERNIAYAASHIFPDGGAEGFYIPRYLAEQYPDLKSVSDLSRYAELFKERGTRGKGRIYGCPPGWACEITTTNMVRAYNLSEQFQLFSPGSGANLKASIARAVARKKPIVTYYWGPTAVIGRYDLVRLNMADYSAQAFACISEPDCVSPQPTSYPPSDVMLMTTYTLQKRAPVITALMSKVSVPNDVINQVLAWGDEQSASTEEIAHYLLKNYPDMWHAWVSDDAKKRIESIL